MRVIAGRYRSRRLVSPKGSSTRPTSDRARETLFAILGELEGARVLDLFAGTGAVGIEALSRGAGHACFVESERKALAALRANLEKIAADADTVVVSHPLPGALDRLAGPFDLVFLDPPYGRGELLHTTLRKLLSVELVADGGRVVVEHASRQPPELPQGLQVDSCRQIGDTAFTFAQREQGCG